MKQQTSSHLWGVAVAAVTLLALVLRLHGIDGPPFKIWDDFFAVRLAVQDWAGILKSLAHQPFDAYQEFQPPLFYMLVHSFLEFGRSDAMLRMTSVLAGTLTVPAVCLMGRRLLGAGTGLLGGLMLAVSLYHIEYSQQVRNYVLFLFLAAWSMHFFSAWLLDRDRRSLPGYWLCTAAMLWSSYMSTVTVVAQMFIWLLFFIPEAKRGFTGAVKAQAPFVAVMALAGAAFLPWLPIYSKTYAVLSGITGNARPPMWETLAITFREFTSYYCEILGYPEAVIWFLALALAGTALALARRTRPALILLGWALVTLVFVLGFNRHGLHVRTRHLIALLPVLFLFCSHPVALLAGRFRRPWQGAALALVAVTALNAFNFRAFPFFYRRDDDRLKDMAYILGTFQRDITREFFWGSDSKWFPDVNRMVMEWYLPGQFKRPGQDFSREYMRAWMLYTPSVAEAVEPLGNVVPQGQRGYVRYALAGVVNTSPAVVDFSQGGRFAFAETFKSPDSYGTLHFLDNIALDRGAAVLSDLNRPGRAEWAFTLPPGASATRGAVAVDASFLADIDGVPDSALTVSASVPGEPARTLGRFAFRDLAARPGFNGKSYDLRDELAIPASLLRDGLVISLEMDPGRDLGVVTLRSFTVTMDGSPAQGGMSPARLRLEHALANTLVAPAGSDGDGPVPLGKPLYAFTTRAADPHDPARVGGAAALARFRERHPGLALVLAIEDGPDSYFLYDPALTGPSLPVPGDYALSTPEGGEIRSLAAWGVVGATGGSTPDRAHGEASGVSSSMSSGVSTGGASVELDGKPVSLASAGREPGVVSVGGDGKGRMVLMPLFMKGGPAAAGAAEVTSGVKQGGGEDCITCVDSKPCHVVYKLSASGGFTNLSVRYYPRVNGDWKLRNSLRVSVSSDGKDFETLDGLRSNGSGHWDGWRVPRAAGKKWSLPQGDIYLRFELSGDGAQLWSSAKFPLIIEADFAVPDGQIPPAASSLGASGLGGSVQALDAPVRGFNHLLRPY